MPRSAKRLSLLLLPGLWQLFLVYPLLFGGFSAEDKIVFLLSPLILFTFLPSVSFKKAVGTAVLTYEVGCMDGTAKGGALTVHGCPIFLSPFVF